MSLGRLTSVFGALGLVGGVAVAQPAEPAPPAEGAPVQPIEDTPSDIEGREEDPDAPRGTGDVTTGPVAPPVVMKSGYPIEEAQRPITLPQNMAEVSIAPHFQADAFMATDALRFRYGITPKIQLGLTYVYAGVYDDPETAGTSKKGFHPGKAGGLDVTVLVTNWMGVKVGLPVYLDPFAMSFAAGAPMKFIFDKWALGALDDVLNITIPVGAEFPPQFYQERENAERAAGDKIGNQQSRGTIRFAGYGVYQLKPNLAAIGRVGLENDLGGGGGGAAGSASSGQTRTFIRGGVQLSPKKFIDVGGSVGFDDLARVGSFGLAGFFAVRI
jgi:hypothetical protein